ncbi:F-box/kelch-repeat protein At3g06240-like [Vicia villosa]|uniref:F-box/kelch-repeat protein At3g06240-like n=1 Tax=Vicia villosa TaxID=3911 RepID=UPI00273C8A9B|nr:F-box/kelch-repeat protein At3g06240-like [Vicia villosa]
MFLPHELIIEILLRLPVKSLIRFKCVCKLWFSLISRDPNFAKSHFQLTASKPNRRILYIPDSSHESRSIDIEASLDNVNASVSLNLDCIFPESFTDNFEVKGSCRGFILLCDYLNMYVWNPSTGVHKQITPSPFGSNVDADYYFYGFGYDDSTDDYLVVSMSHHDYDDPPLHLEYFSLKANTWKEVEGPHFPYTFDDEPKSGSLYKGAIHWLAYHNDLLCHVIVAFDLKERKLSYMHLPRGFDNHVYWGGLWVYEEFLSVYTKNISNDTVEIWVMKEYKVNSSWIMTLVLPVDLVDCPNEDFFPLCCTKSGDIIGTDEDDGLVKYDRNGKFLEQHSYYNYNLRCGVTMYVESLLSLPGDGDKEQT